MRRRDARISRGRFLGGMGAAGVAGSTLSVLSACGSGGGSSGPEEKKLAFYNWSDYVAQSTVPSFEEKTGIQVTQDFYGSNEDLLSKLQGGAAGYDVIVPSDYMVTVMIKEEVIQALDKSKIPNIKNVGEDYMGLSYDPKNEYSLPYQWGTTGILYNKKETGELDGTWDAIWDPRFEGQIAMLNDSRETLGAALYKLGYSVNTKDNAELAEAEQELKRQSPLVRGYFISTEARSLVQNGDVLLGHVYSGDAFLAMSDNEDLDYLIPQPMASRWTDNMSIPASAEHPDNAHKFINHILGVDVGAELSNFTYYNTPNKGAVPKIDEALTKLPGYTLTPEMFERLEVIEDVGAKTREYERIFSEAKSA